MTDLNLRLRLEAEVAQARREIAAVKGDVAALGIATKDASQVTLSDLAAEFIKVDGAANAAKDGAHLLFAELNELANGYDALRMNVDTAYAAQTRYAEGLALTRMAVASGITTEREAAATLDMLAQKLGLVEAKAQVMTGTLQRHTMSSGAAAAASQNLAYQFNDVAVMAASGQSPLMLAIQQGPQIAQAFGPAGAAGALGLLKQGFMAFLNPITLVTIALVAGGAALAQWVMGAGDAAGATKSLDDAISDLDRSISDFKAKSSVSLEDLKKKFGEVTPEVIRLNDEMANLAGVQAIMAATEAMRALKAETEGSWFAMFSDKAFTDLNQAADLLQVDPLVGNLDNKNPQDNTSSKNNPAVEKFQAAIADAGSAKGFDDQIAAVQRVEAAIIEAAGGIDQMTWKQTQLLAKVQASEAALRQMKAAQDEAGSAGEKSAVAQQAMLDTLLHQAAIQQAIMTYGADSAQVATLRLNAERQVHLALVASMTASDEMKQNLINAWEAAHRIESADIARRLAEGAKNASDLSDLLHNAWDAAIGLGTAGPDGDWMSGAIGSVDTLVGKLWAAWYAASSLGQAASVAGFPDLRGPAGMGSSPPTGGAVSTSPRPGRREIDFDPNGSTAGGGGGGGGGGPAKGSLADIKAQAQEAMDTLDLSIAAINEKVQAGLVTSAEAADAVKSAKEQAAGSLADLIAQLDKLGPAGVNAATLIRANMKGLADDLKLAGSDLAKTLSEGFKSPFKDFLTGAKNAHDAMDALGDFVIDKFAEMAAERATTGFIEPLMNMAVSGLGGMFGGLFGGAAAPVVAHALGGVPGGAPLSAWSNQVLDRPTLFPMARGMGLMAEAGKEAIMPVGDGGVLAMLGGRDMRLPLVRGPGGRLGVELPEWTGSMIDRPPVAFAAGGLLQNGRPVGVGAYSGGAGAGGAGGAGAAGVNVQVNVVPPPGHTAQVNDRMEGNDRIIDVLVEQIEGHLAANARAGRGAHVGALADTFGLRRAPR